MTEEIKGVIEAELKKLSNRFYKKKQLDEESIDNLIEKFLDGEDYRLDKICTKIMKNRMLEVHYIKKMSNESKLLEETEEKLFGMTYRIMKVTHWSCQKKLSLSEE